MKKKTLAAAIGLGMALSTVQVQAESLLFPYYQSGGGVWTLLTLHTDFGGTGAVPNLHYIWNYDLLSTGPTECIHEDAYGHSTPVDLIQQTVVDPSVNGGLDLPALFGDASTAAYSLVGGVQGFMIVDDQTLAENTMRGQAIVADTVNNFYYAYKGRNNPSTLDTDASGFADGTEPGFWNHIFTSHLAWELTWYPVNVVNTAWYVIVTGTGMDFPPTGQWLGTVGVGLWTGFVWDRDEDPRSGFVPTSVTCHRVLTRPDFMTAAQIAHTNNGGYAPLATLPFPAVVQGLPNLGTGTIVTKIESITGLGGWLSEENAFPNLPY